MDSTSPHKGIALAAGVINAAWYILIGVSILGVLGFVLLPGIRPESLYSTEIRVEPSAIQYSIVHTESNTSLEVRPTENALPAIFARGEVNIHSPNFMWSMFYVIKEGMWLTWMFMGLYWLRKAILGLKTGSRTDAETAMLLRRVGILSLFVVIAHAALTFFLQVWLSKHVVVTGITIRKDVLPGISEILLPVVLIAFAQVLEQRERVKETAAELPA